jgi:hypothetical protein
VINHNQSITVSGRGVLSFHVEAWFRARAAYMPDTARPINRHPSGLSRDNHQAPVLMSSYALRHVIDGSLSFAFPDHTCHILCDVSLTLTTTTHSPQQLRAI